MTTLSTLSTPLRIGVASWLVPVRAAVVSGLGALVLAGLAVVDLAVGDVSIRFGSVIEVLLGKGQTADRFIVLELRVPQTMVALLVGMALGLSGALIQIFARNPLASPDILGINNGAAAAAVGYLVLAGGGGTVAGTLGALGLPLAAFLGAVLTSLALYVLSWRRGIDGQRLVLIGIGLGAALTAVTSWLLVKARLPDAAAAQVWLNGSLNGRGWQQGLPLAIALAVLIPAALVLVHALNALQLGDDNARGLGVRLQYTQLWTLLTAVALAAVSVAAVGPLGFVAFVVPQVALRLVGGSRPPVVASMLVGGCLVVGADLAVRVVIPFSIPAGLVTQAIGAPYLIWLLLRANRKASA